MANKITVLLVDDHSLVRRGFRRMLEDEADMEVVGEAGDGEESIKLAKKLHPQVVVMDCALPGMNGLDATRQIIEDSPQTAVLMLSMHAENTWVRQAIEAGAKGYVLGADAAGAGSVADDRRRQVEQGDCNGARPQRQHDRGSPREHHELAGNS